MDKLWAGRRRALMDLSSKKAPKGKFSRKRHQKDNLALKCDEIFDIIDNDNVPKIEETFVEDQRSRRERFIGNVDKAESEKIERRNKRIMLENERRES